MSHLPYPDNTFPPEVSPTHLPHLEHKYRLFADMGDDHCDLPDGRGTGMTKPAAGQGSKLYPMHYHYLLGRPSLLSDEIRDKVVYMLASRYTILTHHGCRILVNARGVFTLDPDFSRMGVEASACSREDRRESFSHLTYSAPESSRYSWMNSIVAVGLMTTSDGKTIFDAYRLTVPPDRDKCAD